MVYSSRPLFMNPTGWLPGTLNADGTVSLPSGEVLSVQPDGSYQTRPQGTAGEYEVAQRVGDKLVFTPGGAIHVVAMVG